LETHFFSASSFVIPALRYSSSSVIGVISGI
jgi:hypothetical protein